MAYELWELKDVGFRRTVLVILAIPFLASSILLAAACSPFVGLLIAFRCIRSTWLGNNPGSLDDMMRAWVDGVTPSKTTHKYNMMMDVETTGLPINEDFLSCDGDEDFLEIDTYDSKVDDLNSANPGEVDMRVPMSTVAQLLETAVGLGIVKMNEELEAIDEVRTVHPRQFNGLDSEIPENKVLLVYVKEVDVCGEIMVTQFFVTVGTFCNGVWSVIADSDEGMAAVALTSSVDDDLRMGYFVEGWMEPPTVRMEYESPEVKLRDATVDNLHVSKCCAVLSDNVDFQVHFTVGNESHTVYANENKVSLTWVELIPEDCTEDTPVGELHIRVPYEGRSTKIVENLSELMENLDEKHSE